jgi:hypothetical protein
MTIQKLIKEHGSDNIELLGNSFIAEYIETNDINPNDKQKELMKRSFNKFITRSKKELGKEFALQIGQNLDCLKLDIEDIFEYKAEGRKKN